MSGASAAVMVEGEEEEVEEVVVAAAAERFSRTQALTRTRLSWPTGRPRG